MRLAPAPALVLVATANCWPSPCREQVRKEATALAARENAKTAAVVAHNKALNKALASIVPDLAGKTAASSQTPRAAPVEDAQDDAEMTR